MHGAPAEALEHLKQTYAEGGHAGIWRLVLQRAARQPQDFPAMQLALMCGETGDLDSAFLHLDRALDGHDPSLVHLSIAPQWDSLRVDPRFGQRLARIGLAG